MFRPRIIPCLLLRNKGLVKTVKFRNARYIGDPMNAVRIFNAKQADELIFLDIDATSEKRQLPLDLVEKIADEAFMPFTVGGSISTIPQIREVLSRGAEKVSINSHAILNPDFVSKAADVFGSSTIVVSIDVRKKLFGGYEVYTHGGKKGTGLSPQNVACTMERMGAGELLINSIDREGTMEGYDLDLIQEVSNAVTIPVVACGGAGELEDFFAATREANASSASAGSYFVYHGPRRAVLINFPSQNELKSLFSSEEEVLRVKEHAFA
jgi:cyclase